MTTDPETRGIRRSPVVEWLQAAHWAAGSLVERCSPHLIVRAQHRDVHARTREVA